MSSKIECMRYAGRINQEAIEWGFRIALPGISLRQINESIEKYILENDCRPAFKDYCPPFSNIPFPAAVCMSPNAVVVHGIPGDYILQPGDLLTIDVGSEYKGWYVDSARSRVIPCWIEYSPQQQRNAEKAEYLIKVTEMILGAQLSVIRDGCTFLDLIEVSETIATAYDIRIIPQYGGHYIGDKVHIEPYIPAAINRKQTDLKQKLDAKQYARQKLSEGETICIEPVTTLGDTDIILDEDLWTVRKKDGSLAAHTERCLLVTKNGYELLS